MNRHPKEIINALAVAAACFLAAGLSSCTTEEMEASLSYSPTSVSVGSTGGSFEIALSDTVGYSVSVSGEWLSLTSGGDELYVLSDGEYFCRVPGSAVLGFTAESNTSSSTRTATITLSAGDITNSILVTQAGISLSVSPASVSVAAAGESFTVTVTCDTDYSVDISDTWLTLNSNSGGTLSFTADANTSGSSRTATITVTAGDLSSTVTVTQAGISLSVSPTTVSVDAAGGTFSITVTCIVSNYSTSCSASWLTFDYASGDVYTYTASENTSTSSRTGTITVTAGAVSATVTVTQEGTMTINGYEYVDLGLSVKWATCNIGADSPEDYGNYYAWGETETKDTYTSSNSVTYGVEMDDFSGDAEYDAATANWGSPWRIPTEAEIKELQSSCTWTWTTMNDVNGYEVTGTNGNSIFLPAAGYRSSSSLSYAGSYGHYWSSTPSPSSTDYAYFLSLKDSSVGGGLFTRYRGRSVRPVSE